MVSIPTDKETIICGNINKQLGQNPSHFASITVSFSLCNVICLQHLTAADIPIYNRGPTCLDYIFSLKGFLPFITNTGYNIFSKTYQLDHYISFYNIQLKFFLAQSFPLWPPQIFVLFPAIVTTSKNLLQVSLPTCKKTTSSRNSKPSCPSFPRTQNHGKPLMSLISLLLKLFAIQRHTLLQPCLICGFQQLQLLAKNIVFGKQSFLLTK